MIEAVWSIDHIEGGLKHYIEEMEIEGHQDLIERIAALDWPQKCVIVDQAERYWAIQRSKE
jgi:hypothetical protein